MNALLRLATPPVLFICAVLAFAGAPGTAHAQDTATPAPAMTAAPAATPVPAMTPMPPATEPAYDPFDGRVHYTVTPYVWLPSVNGSLNFHVPPIVSNFRSGEINVQAGPNDYLAHLNFAAMLTGEIRKGEFAIVPDFLNVNLSGGNTKVRTITGPNGNVIIPVDRGSTISAATTLWQIAGSGTVTHGTDGNLDVLVGYRSVTTNARVSWNLNTGGGIINLHGSASHSSTLGGDMIFGFRGTLLLSGGKWFVPFYFDAGSGMQNTTTQQIIGVGMRFPHRQSIALVFRNLQYNFTGDSAIQQLRLGGPAIGYSFRF
ncbi:MAG: hypothetical protein ACLQPV_00355 [Vulcanimicrobiaceae bacterium]